MILVINILYYTLVILIFARIILSFINIGSYEIRDLVFRLTEPILAPHPQYFAANGRPRL